MGLDVDPTPGEEVQKIVRKVYETPPDIVEKAKASTLPPQ